MSLSEAVMAVVEAMEKEADEPCSCDSSTVEGLAVWSAVLRKALKSYARELRVAVKASAGAPQTQLPFPNALTPGWGQVVSPQAQHAQMIEQARAEFRKQKQRGDAEEGLEGKMVYAKGGPCDGTMVNIPSDVKPGMKSIIAGGIYQYGEDNILHHLAVDPNPVTSNP